MDELFDEQLSLTVFIHGEQGELSNLQNMETDLRQQIEVLLALQKEAKERMATISEKWEALHSH